MVVEGSFDGVVFCIVVRGVIVMGVLSSGSTGATVVYVSRSC